jgi:hypothetical protein
MRYRYVADPHPHLFLEEIVAPNRYAAMPFPDALVAPGASWGITGTDHEYQDVLRHPLWRAVWPSQASGAGGRALRQLGHAALECRRGHADERGRA